MEDQKGVIHPSTLIVVVVVIAVWVLVIYLLLSQGIIKKPSFKPKEVAKVELKSEYKNPFDKKAQFVNPFDQYKSPFQNLK